MRNIQLSTEANRAISEAVDGFTKAVIQLNTQQAACVTEFKVKSNTIASQLNSNEESRATAHSAVDSKYNENNESLKLQKVQLKAAYNQKLITLGVKNPDVALSERVVVKVIDNTIKRGLGFIGRVKAYVGNAIEAGAAQ